MNFEQMVNQIKDPNLKRKIQELAKSPKGKDAVKKLENLDKNTIDQYINNINRNKISQEVMEKISKLLK
ncbi:MAG: hypothetical protein IJC06_01295 [Clostridia bacterium]|nr:hypothetical protein [Clostridia bacterium]